MAGLPTILPNGYVAIYGSCQDTFSSDGTQFPSSFRYGTIYNIWDGGAPYIYGGDLVSFNEKDVSCRIASGGVTYTIVQARLVTKQGAVL